MAHIGFTDPQERENFLNRLGQEGYQKDFVGENLTVVIFEIEGQIVVSYNEPHWEDPNKQFYGVFYPEKLLLGKEGQAQAGKEGKY